MRGQRAADAALKLLQEFGDDSKEESGTDPGACIDVRA
jgi:hypothetical protein